jgi:hypothetical protein
MFGLINRTFKTSKISTISYIFKEFKQSSYQVMSYSNTSPSFKQQKEPLDDPSDDSDQETILALPEHSEELIKESKNDDVKKSGTDYNYKLRNLGPVVVNEDGSISTINNW